TNGQVTSDLSGTITFNYNWNEKFRKWDRSGYTINSFENNITITGKVISGMGNSGFPVNEARIYVSSAGIPSKLYHTDSNGNFIFKVFVPQKGSVTYNLAFQHDELDTITRTLTLKFRDGDQNLGNIALSLPGEFTELATVSGKVIDRDGNPVENAYVFITDLNFENEHFIWDTTDKDGVYVIPMLKRGQYFVNARIGKAKGNQYITFSQNQIGQIISVSDLSLSNSRPVINDVFIVGTPSMNGKIELISIATDNDNDVLSYTWTCSGGEISSDPTLPSVTWNLPEIPGTYSITVTVNDGNGGSMFKRTTISLY
ncbi:MAG: carboxypeptidase regulatory-like domain-containing protein, partial [Candidatus Muiribacteriota bacterium]